MAVYTKVSELDAADFLRAYDIGELRQLAGIKQGVENSNYRLETSNGRYILTLFEQRTRAEDLPFFLGLMGHLSAADFPCPKPVAAKNGEMLQNLAGRPAVIVSFLEGTAPTRITADECAEAGRAMARFHLAGRDFNLQRANTLSLDGWEKLLAATVARADEVAPDLAAVLKKEMDYLNRNWPKDLPQGVIHADMFPDNVFFDGSKLCGVIDFYFACVDILAYDLAVALNAWCFEGNHRFNITKARALLKGYEEIRPLSAAEKKALPLLARGSATRFLLTRLYDWLNRVPDALVKPKDPMDYLARLQFHQMAADVSAYGIDA